MSHLIKNRRQKILLKNALVLYEIYDWAPLCQITVKYGIQNGIVCTLWTDNLKVHMDDFL